MSAKYKILREEAYSSPHNSKYQLIDTILQLPTGEEVNWQYIKTRDAVNIVAVSAGSIYCVRQWRPARKGFVWELPAGGIEVPHPSSTQVLENANRELQEEVGFKAGHLEILSAFSPIVHTTSTYYVVLATDLQASSLPKDQGEENMEIKLLPFDQAYDLLTRQQQPTAFDLVALLLARPHLKS